MPAKNLLRKVDVGIYSHIYNRGIEKRIIFNDQEDYQVFLGFLKDYLSLPQDPENTKKNFTVHGRIFRGSPHQPKNYFDKVELIAYNLMPDHFHLLLYQKTQGSIESFIRSLCTRYSIYFNKKYQRTGSLFEGPYKSVEIKDTTLLLHLTRYLHLVGEHNSCLEYLGKQITQWVKPDVVLSSLDQSTGSYKEFMDKYEPDQNEKEILQSIILENWTAHLERINPPQIVENHPQQPAREFSKKRDQVSNLKPVQRIPEFLSAIVIFSLLFAIGLTNMMIFKNDRTKSFTLGVDINGLETKMFSLANAPNPSNNNKVLGSAISPTASLTPLPIPSPKLEIGTASADLTKPKKMAIIDTGNSEESVNIRQKPTNKSPKVAKGKNGDTFDIVSINSGWYEIKLADGSTGFISDKYIKLGGNIANE